MDIVFGMPVVGADGADAGALDRVLADPRRRALTHLVIRAPQLSEEVLLPVAYLNGLDEGRLRLGLAAGELESLPRYYEGRESSPPAGRVDETPVSIVGGPGDGRPDLAAAAEVATDAVELGPDTPVAAGRLNGLTLDGSGWRIRAARVLDAAARERTVAVDELAALGGSLPPVDGREERPSAGQ